MLHPMVDGEKGHNERGGTREEQRREAGRGREGGGEGVN